jgi:flagellar M-ring protein FliF
MRQFFASMSHRARIAFAIGILLIAGIVGAASWWIMHPPYGVLFRDLRETDAAEITTALDQMQVPYRLTDEGKTIMVPDAEVYETRMKLVSQGVPKGGSVGFELFKDSDYGVTEFAQKINFQRALQGELERTISSLDEVASARVHLTIRRSDLFAPDQDPSKASVTLNLRPGKHLDAREVAGIQRLVASAVDGLTPETVVVLDDKGMVLSGYSEGQNSALNSDGLDAQTQLENQLRTRVGELLHRVLRTDNFTVSVDVSLDYDHVKQVREQLIAQGKDGNGLLVHEKVNSTGHSLDDSDPDHAKGGTTSSDRDVEYAHGREQEEIDQAPGRVGRISVGIVIPATLPPSEISKLNDVVSAALGLDASRGDKVDIAAIAPPEPVSADVPGPGTSAVSHLDAAASNAVATDEATSSAVAASRYWWIYPVIVALVLLLVGSLLMAMRTTTPRRLTMSEREAALLRLRQWIETTEVER